MPEDQPASKDDESKPLIRDALEEVVRRIFHRGRREFQRAASQSRHRMERWQLQRDLDQFWIRLGKTAFRLVEGGEIDHPDIRLAMRRIRELQEELKKTEEPEHK